MIMLTAILFELDWLHNGFVALDWIIEERKQRGKYTWPAVGGVAAVNLITAIFEGVRQN